MARKRSPSRGARVEKRKAQRAATKIQTVPEKGKSLEIPPHIAAIKAALVGRQCNDPDRKEHQTCDCRDFDISKLRLPEDL